MERKTIKHKVHTIEEKNKIVTDYLKYGKVQDLVRKNDICDKSTIYRWIRQFKKYGTTVDNRGTSTKGKGNFNKKIKPEEMTKEELILYVKAMEDIKKQVVYQKKQKINMKYLI